MRRRGELIVYLFVRGSSVVARAGRAGFCDGWPGPRRIRRRRSDRVVPAAGAGATYYCVWTSC